MSGFVQCEIPDICGKIRTFWTEPDIFAIRILATPTIDWRNPRTVSDPDSDLEPIDGRLVVLHL